MTTWLTDLAQFIDPVVVLSLTAAIAALMLYVRRQNRIFKLQVRNRHVKVIKGVVPQDFLQSCRRIANATNFKGTISAFDTRSGIELRFTGNFPLKVQETIRSAFPVQRYRKSFFRHWRDHKSHRPQKKNAG